MGADTEAPAQTKTTSRNQVKMNWEAIAEQGYGVYWERMVSAGHIEVPPWSRLTLIERISWIVATKEICAIQASAALA